MHEFHEEDNDYFCRFSFGQFVSLALLEVVALFFVFYLGARYGPGFIGHKETTVQEQVTQLPEDADAYETGQPNDVQVRYTYPESLTRKADPAYVPQQAHVPQRTAPPPPPPAEVQVATRQPPPEPQPAPAPKADGYSIQLGSFRHAESAADKVNQWQAKGYDAFLSVGQVPQQGTVYRVRIGNFSSRDRARAFLQSLVNRENVSAIIVRSNS